MYNGPADPALYINQINLLPAVSYDVNIGLASPGATFDTNHGAYDLGTAILPDTALYLYNGVSRSGNVDPSVLNGIYNFSLEIKGGSDNLATDVLGTIPYQIEIANGILVSVAAVAAPGSISAGQTSAVTATLTNNDPTRTFVTTTWFVSTFSTGTDNLPFVDFAGDWFDKSILPGDSRTDDHSTWDATDTTPLGTYSGLVGVVGGLYNGDNMYVLASPAPTVDVVTPEPASLGLILVGAASLLRRRRAERAIRENDN